MRRAVLAALAFALVASPAAAQGAAAPFAAPKALGPLVPDTTPDVPPDATTPPGEPDTWIFSGILEDSNETFSGTLITGKADTEFELKLADGATCDGGDLHPSLGLVRLSEITCSDDRKMRALFVPQGHETLKVFGHVGDARFRTVAHLLGYQAIPEPTQTAAPHAPAAPPVEQMPTKPRLPPLPGAPKDHDG